MCKSKALGGVLAYHGTHFSMHGIGRKSKVELEMTKEEFKRRSSCYEQTNTFDSLWREGRFVNAYSTNKTLPEARDSTRR